MSKHQVIFIHGGETFDSYQEYLAALEHMTIDIYKLDTKKWKETLAPRLGNDFKVHLLEMPNKLNAKYTEWKIWFDKFLPYVKDNVILIGHSLGGIFLAKYLAENLFPKRVKGLFLIAAPFDDRDTTESLADFILPKSLKNVDENVQNIFLYHSKDDPVVRFEDVQKYQVALSRAQLRVFEDKKHFVMEEFSELMNDIKRLF